MRMRYTCPCAYSCPCPCAYSCPCACACACPCLCLQAEQEGAASWRAQHAAAASHADDVHRAALARLSSQHAAQASQASVELERLRQERANDAQHAQQLLTEAKEETARA